MTDTQRQTPLRAHGYLDSLAFDGSDIWVFRNKKHIETIPLAAVDAINTRPSTRLVNGVVEIVHHGDQARAVVFTHGHRTEFATIADVLLAARSRFPPPRLAPMPSPGQPLVAWGIRGNAVTFDGYTIYVYVNDHLINQVNLAQLGSVSVTPIRPADGNLTLAIRGGRAVVVGYKAADRPAFSRIADAVHHSRMDPQPIASTGPGVDPWTASSLPVASSQTPTYAPGPASAPRPYNPAAALSPQNGRALRRLLTFSMWTEGFMLLWLLIPTLLVVAICGWSLLR